MLHIFCTSPSIPKHLCDTATIEFNAICRPDVVVRFSPDDPIPAGFLDRLLTLPLTISLDEFEAVCIAKHVEVIQDFYRSTQAPLITPLVSVFTAWAHPKNAWVNEALAALQAQTYTNWEWVCVGTPPTSFSPPVAQKNWRFYKRYTHAGINVGLAKDEAARLCRGEILIELDHDDLLTPNALEIIVRTFREQPTREFVYGNCAWFRAEDRMPILNARYLHTARVVSDVIYQERHQKDLFDQVTQIPGPSSWFGWWLPYGPIHPMAFRRRAFLEIGGYNPEMKFAEDWELMARFMARGHVKHIDELLYLYRINAIDAERTNSMFKHSSSGNWHLQQAQANLAPILASAFKRYGVEVQESLRGEDVTLVAVDYDGSETAAWWLDQATRHLPGAERLLIRNGDFESQINTLASKKELLEDIIGPHSTTFLGLRRATRPLVLFAQNSDFDQYHPTSVDTLLAHLRTSPEVLHEVMPAANILGIRRIETLKKRYQDSGLGVSVIIATFKRTKSGLLESAIRSVTAQDYPYPVEILIVGDACPELSELELSMFGGNIHIFNLCKNHNDLGSAVRNYGLLQSWNSWIAYLDDDNTWAPDHLRTVMGAIQTVGARWGCSSMNVKGEKFEFTGVQCGLVDTSAIIHHIDLPFQCGFWQPYSTAGYANDWDFVSRFLSAGLRPACSNRATLNYNLDTINDYNRERRSAFRKTLGLR